MKLTIDSGVDYIFDDFEWELFINKDIKSTRHDLPYLEISGPGAESSINDTGDGNGPTLKLRLPSRVVQAIVKNYDEESGIFTPSQKS